ncbi:MAG: hypothetical protein COA79_23375 [Planctomycetota bacterium]|nr:MAG: hypothetical protein COA79_23375 [Planctomycetota bacterium]
MRTDNFKNIIDLQNVSYFKAHDTREPTPSTIKNKILVIELITGGCVIDDTGDKALDCPMGSIFWHSPGGKTIYHFKKGEPYRCLSIRFSVKKDFPLIIPRYSFWDKPVEVLNFTDEALRCFHDDSYDNEILARFIYQTLFWKAYSYSKTKLPDNIPLELKKAIQYIQKEFTSDLSVNQIAEHSDISIPHLHSLFKKHLNNTPHNYLLTRRMQHARYLLATTNTPIKQICQLCGFINLENFCRRFKRFTKTTPSHYRDKHSIDHFE